MKEKYKFSYKKSKENVKYLTGSIQDRRMYVREI